MEIAQLRATLRRHRRIALDANLFIYHTERNPTYFDLADEVFAWLESAGNSALTSTVTMTELLVRPYQIGDQVLLGALYNLLSTYPHLDWISVDLTVADLAAKIRAQHRLKTPDAMQAASTIFGQATALVTNDRIFQGIPDFQTVLLDDYL